VTRGEVRELIAGRGAGLADQVELDRWLPALAAVRTGSRARARPSSSRCGSTLPARWSPRAVARRRWIAARSRWPGRAGWRRAACGWAPSLPAGVQVDVPGLEAQVASGAIRRFTASDGALDLEVAPLAPGATFALTYRAIATLAGALHTGASRIEAGADRFDVPPATWVIR
jgi:hypothetical protein